MPKAKSKEEKRGEKVKPKRLVILDAHAIIHRAYHALPEDFATSAGVPTGALYGLATMLIKIIGELKPDYMAAAYDLPKPTYRHAAYEDYKGKRAKTDDALVAQLKRSREIFEAFNIPVYDAEGFEADDVLGTIVQTLHATRSTLHCDVIIASGDMDTLQLVDGDRVRVYTLKKGIQDTILYNEEKVKERFGFGPEFLPDFKGLRGDPSDNIIGIPGIGEKTATELIQKFGHIEDIYDKLGKDKKAFEKEGVKARVVLLLEKHKEEAEFSKMLAVIRRDAPVLFKLPEKEWKESVDEKKAEEIFSRFEFRTMAARFREAVGGNKEVGIRNNELGIRNKEEEDIDKDELKETQIALWLINSSITSPKLEDIFSFAKTKDFAKARQAVFSELEKRNLKKVFEEIERPLIAVVRKMNKRGVKIDTEYLNKLSKEYHKELTKLEENIWKEAAPHTKESDMEKFNVASPKQLAVVLFDRMGLTAKGLKKTEGGARSTKESELLKLKDAHPIIELILEYREFAKLLSTYIDNMPQMADAGGRLHAEFLQAGAATGRMASQNPGLQNIPIKTEAGKRIRNAFIAEDGFKILSIDYSQIELRVAAILSSDPKLLEIFRNGEDVHTAVASEVFGVEREKVDYEMRRKAKVINFGIIYGMGINALKTNLGASREEATKFHNDYFEKFSTLARYLDEVKAFAYKEGYTETLFGRRRYFEGLKSVLPFIRAASERQAINAPLQGTAADVIKLAMLRVDEFLQKENLEDKVYLTMQVHDELVYEVKEDLVEKVAPKIREVMEGVLSPKESKEVPMMAESYVGKNWGAMQRIADSSQT